MKTNNNICRGYKKSTALLLDLFTELVGRKSWSKIAQPCTGKWRGTTDYGILFDDGMQYFISNGMQCFNEKLANEITSIHVLRNNHKKYLQILREQARLDNEIARKEGLHPVTIVDVGQEMESENHFLWAYVILDVNGHWFKFTETGLNYAMKQDAMDKWIEGCKKSLFTAGGVKLPDYIFANVRFSSTDQLYKIK